MLLILTPLFDVFNVSIFRRLGDEMRSMSLEKSRQREVELAQEIERLQMEIKTLQKNSEEAANVNQQLSKEVRLIELLQSYCFYHFGHTFFYFFFVLAFLRCII